MRKCKNCKKYHDARNVYQRNRHLKGECMSIPVCSRCGKVYDHASGDGLIHNCNEQDVINYAELRGIMLGRKDDNEKIRMDLVPFDALQEVAKVLTFGAKKYAPNNWMFVDNPIERYQAAMLRHITAYKTGEELDSETGLPHLAHAACCLMFLISFETKK